VAHGFIGTTIVIAVLIDSPPPCNHGRGFPAVIALFAGGKKIWVFQQVMRLKTASSLFFDRVAGRQITSSPKKTYVFVVVDFFGSPASSMGDGRVRARI
jgi:hypothetical protein